MITVKTFEGLEATSSRLLPPSLIMVNARCSAFGDSVSAKPLACTRSLPFAFRFEFEHIASSGQGPSGQPGKTMASPAQASTSATTVESVTTAATAPAHEHIENGTSLQERPRKRQRSQEPQAEDDSSSFPHTADDQSSPRPFELSYFGIAPHDEFTREIGQRIWSLAKDGKYVEIEAKIGLLLDANTRRKLNFPVATECSKSTLCHRCTVRPPDCLLRSQFSPAKAWCASKAICLEGSMLI